MGCVSPVALVTQEGDADLYASIDMKDPGYGNGQFSSSSCGLDLIVVPWKDESRDSHHIYLSVVGHGRHQESQYKMFVITPANDDITKYQVCPPPRKLGGGMVSLPCAAGLGLGPRNWPQCSLGGLRPLRDCQ